MAGAMRLFARSLCVLAVVVGLCVPGAATAAEASAPERLVVGYQSAAELARLDARVVRRIPALHSAIVEARGPVDGQAPVLQRGRRS